MWEIEASEFCALKSRQELLKQRLTIPVVKLFGDLTGVRLHLFWHHPFDFCRPGQLPIVCPAACVKSSPRAPSLVACRSCLQRQWRLPSPCAGQGRLFKGVCGAQNYCVCVPAGNGCAVTLVLQAWIWSDVGAAGVGRRDPEHLRAAAASGHPEVSAASFHGAVALLRLILHDLGVTIQNRMAQGELEAARRRLKHLEVVYARLRKELRRRIPDVGESAGHPAAGSHVEQVVQAMLGYIRKNYQHPLSLGEVAGDMKMNATYLSNLFSQTVGVTFHHYLEELRLAKARDLLCNPRTRVGDVAGAIGYSSPNHFRNVFKAHEGLSPSAWRETAPRLC